MASYKKISLFDVINLVVFLSLVFVCVFPFYFMFINTISSSDQIARGNVTFYPIGVHFLNYVNVLKISAIWKAAGVSAARTILGTLLTVFMCSFFAYLMTKKVMFMRTFIYRFLIVTMYFNAGLIPWYITMKNLGLMDNFFVYVLPGALSAFNVILIKTYIDQIPPSMEESAMLDGAGVFSIYFRILLPLCTPIIATIAIFSSVGHWNTFQDNLFLVHDQNLQTLQMLLYRYMKQIESFANMIRTQGISAAAYTGYTPNPMAIRMTVSIIVVFPILLVYPFMQKYFVKGILIGAVKG